jgi:EpsD family peptidyl-prolyl cis-trans isomerase
MRQRTLNALAALAALALSGCGKPASADARDVPALPLATVNGVDISMLAPAGAKGAPVDRLAVDKRKLEALIDSQLLQEEAVRNRLDRDPQVLQAIERAKTEILAQAHLQAKFAQVAAPTPAEIDAYFRAHPELFAERKLFYIKQLVLDGKDFTPQLQQQVDHAASIEQVARWLDARQVHYERAQLARSSAELAPELLAQLKTMRKHQLFVVKAGTHAMLDALQDVTANPVTAAAAAPQIQAFLLNKRRQQAGELEIQRLRAQARIDYFNQQQSGAPGATAEASSTTMEKQ